MNLNWTRMSTGTPTTASFGLRLVADESPDARGSRAATEALVIRAVEEHLAGRDGHAFLALRAGREVAAFPAGLERRVLRALMAQLAPEGDAERIPRLLVRWAAVLEESARHAAADAALSLAAVAAPRDAEVALHAGRLARKLGERERALGLYRRTAELDERCGPLTRLARIGEALVDADPDRALARVIRESAAAGDREAAAVGLEERAQLRRAAGDLRGAARDLAAAALRFVDAVDRARAAHQLADVAVAAGDPLAAREALLGALAVGGEGQREHARVRLHALSRDLGDRVGMRRWRAARRPTLVSVGLHRRRPGGGPTSAPALGRWRTRLERAAARAAV